MGCIDALNGWSDSNPPASWLCVLQVQPYTSQQLCEALDAVAAGTVSISTAVGPAVGCLMATFGTSLITDCIFDFEDPEQLTEVGLQQRLELWGLQVGLGLVPASRHTGYPVSAERSYCRGYTTGLPGVMLCPEGGLRQPVSVLQE